MKEIILKLAVAVAAFLIGIAGTTFWFFDAFSSAATSGTQTVINVMPLDSTPSVETPANQNTKSAKTIKRADKQKIDELISSLGRDIGENSQKSSDSLIKFVGNNPDRRSYAVDQLMAETTRICGTNERFIHSDFDKLRSMSNALADLEAIEALDLLIDCSNRRSPVGGLSPSNYPTISAIVKYKEKAFPALIKKMWAKETDREVKDRIPSIWSIITQKRFSF